MRLSPTFSLSLFQLRYSFHALLLGVFLVYTLLAVEGSKNADAAASSAVKHFRVSIDSTPEYSDISRSATRHGLVILNFYETAKLQALKRANPNIKVLMYKNLSAMSSYGSTPPFSSGVGYAEADTAHPDWFLLNTSGQRFSWGGYNWLWAADVGNTAYQNAWADKVVAELKADIWDGVFMDDVNYSIKYHHNPSAVAKYPSDAQYGAAMRSMVANVGPKIRAAGETAIANMQWAEFPAPTNDWLQFLDGGMDEVFAKWGTTYTGIESVSVEPGRWTTQLNNAKEAERQGKIMLAVTQVPNGDNAIARYGYATALLAGQGDIYYVQAGDYTHETWYPEYDYNLGDPTAPESTDANGIHRRPFTNGLVLVNPTTTTLTVSFGGTYSGSGLTNATAATMAPRSARILIKSGGTATVRSARSSQRTVASPLDALGTSRPATTVVLSRMVEELHVWLCPTDPDNRRQLWMRRPRPAFHRTPRPMSRDPSWLKHWLAAVLREMPHSGRATAG